jgi:hypothetical protein
MQQVTQVDPFPPGSRILHIGPPKTGTTAVQSALFRRQAELAQYGVAYPGRRRHERAAVSAVALEWAPPGYAGDIEKHWRRLTDEVRTSTADRVVVSSEIFAVAPDSRLARIVGDLGGPLQVVITIRPLALMLPSQWQELVQNLEVLDYDSWLRRLLVDPGTHGTESLWRQTRVDRLVERWGAHVGEENVTVIVLEPGERSMLLDTFERLLALPPGFLVPAEGESNLSLPYPEAEVMRAFNRRFREHGHDPDLHVRAIRRGALRQVKSTGRPLMAHDPIRTPRWAVERANAVAVEMADAIRCSGARVIGDLDRLVTSAEDAPASGGPPTTVPVDSAAEIAYGMFIGGRTHASQRLGAARRAQQRSISDVPAKNLVRQVLGRVATRLRPTRGASRTSTGRQGAPWSR